MELNITGQNIKITPALKNHIKEKIDKLNHNFELLGEIHVILKTEKGQHTAEATLHVVGKNLFARACEEDMYKSIDQMVAKLNSQIVKTKEKHVDRRRNKEEV